MKKIILFLAIGFSSAAYSQDTTKIINLQLQARTIAVLERSLFEPDNPEYFKVWVKWYNLFHATNYVATALVTTDTIPTTVVVYLYSVLLQQPDGLATSGIFKTAITSHRASNPMLNRLATKLEDEYQLRYQNIIQNGKRRLRGQ